MENKKINKDKGKRIEVKILDDPLILYSIKKKIYGHILNTQTNKKYSDDYFTYTISHKVHTHFLTLNS